LQRARGVEALRARLHNTTSHLAVALLLALSCAFALAACGGSGESARSLLSDTFSGHTQINSGEVNLSFAVSAATGSGASAKTKPLSVRLSGPFENAGAGALPRFALQLALTASGHTLAAGATSTGSALFVDLAGTWFSTPQSTYSALQQSYAKATKTASESKVRSTFASLGIEPAHWLSNPTEVGTATIAGEQTVHLTADVDVAALLADVSKASGATAALGLGSPVPVPGALSSTATGELSKSVKSVRVDIYTGQSDHLLRRLEVSAVLAGTAQTQAVLGGLKEAQVKLQVELSRLNQPQTIAAPSNPQSATQLLPALEQLVGGLQSVTGAAPSGL
jgi:hypothetical protein